jgi:HD-like signal output (HDOD) protein
MGKSILLAVKDPQLLIDTTQALGAEWEAISVACEEDALEQVEKRPFDAFLADFNLGSPDASDLLNMVLEKRPETPCFLLAYEADLALVAAKVNGSPHILPKPIEPASLKSRIESGVKGSDSEPSESQPAATETAPPVSPVYAEVLKALEAPDVTSKLAGEIIARDAELTAQILKLTNSSYLGLPGNITDPAKAVESLGLEAVRAAVMALQFLAEHSQLRPGYLSLDDIWQHSINVGQIARDLVLFETKDRTLASQALAAGLLHDLGKVVLAKNFDDLYGRVYSLGRKQPVAIWDIEKEMFGANHGEIGACLVGMWNLPGPIVDAAALHHEPPVGEHDQLTPLAAVHVANVLEHELRPEGKEMMVAPIINTPFLNQLGLLQRLPIWRASFANRRGGNLLPKAESSQPNPAGVAGARSRSTNEMPEPSRTNTLRHPSIDDGESTVSPIYRRSWIFAGPAAILLLLALWFTSQPEPSPNPHARQSSDAPVYARTPGPGEASVFAPSPNPAPGSTTEAAPAAKEPSAPPVPAETSGEPINFLPPPEAAPGATETVARPASAPVPSHNPAVPPSPNSAAPASNPGAPTVAAVPAERKPLSDLRLSGIIYSARPSAIVNGQIVHQGDKVDGTTVVIGITPTTVTLQVHGQRKVLELH